MRLKKIIVTTLIIATIASTDTVAFADTTTTDKPSTTITENFDLNIENTLFNIKQVTSAITALQAQGVVTNDILLSLSTELMNLSNAVLTSGATASQDVIAAVLQAEKAVNTVTETTENADGLMKAKASLLVVKSSFGITTESKQTITNTEVQAVKVTYPTSFKDIKKGNSYYVAVTKLAKLGAIGGYKDGTFKAKTNITNAKFITILMRAVNPKLSRATKGVDYTNGIVTAALKAGIVKSSELLPDNYSAALTKKNMALWTARAIEYKSGNKETKQLINIDNLISDYYKIEGSKYQDAVKDLYSLGILTSDTFKADSKVTRGTAVMVILKAIDKTERKDMGKVNIPDTSTEARDTKLLYWNDPNRGLAKIGDTWVAKNGTKTVLKGIEWNGITVPGYGQGIDLYSGLVSDGGATLKVNNDGEGENAGWYHDDMTYMGQALLSKKSHLGVTFTCFRDQWLAIEQYEDKLTYSIKNPKDGDYW